MNLADLDQAVVDAVDGVVAAGHARPAGLADVPAGAGWTGDAGASPFVPYLRVDPTDTPRISMLLSDAHAHARGEWIVKGVALTPHLAKTIAVAAREAFLSDPLVPPAGIAITMTRVESVDGPWVDYDVVPELFVASCTLELSLHKEP